MNLNNSLRKTPVAVIGLSAIFADATNVEEFWTNIIQGKDSITDVPESRWRIEDYYDPDMTAPDKTYCKRGGFIPKLDFNPMEFGLPPNFLEVTDTSQLLGLIAARDALKDAGYGKNSEKFTTALKAKTGVLLGVGGGQKLITPLIARLQYPVWEKALRASGVAEEDIPKIVDKIKKAYVGWNENSFPGLLGNVISGRITNRFDLGGINSVVDAACAASLSAIKMSLSELVEGRCDMMLSGGVDTDNSPFMYMSFSKTPAFSKSNHITPFSDEADGMLIGEGLGMMVLKRLEDAERDGDRIYAVIKGVGTSSDGRFKSVYAPRPSGQASAMNRAYEEAGYSPASIGLIEAHGTGTGAGDPTEFTSMQMVFGKDNPNKQHIALGSVKSQIGHTKAAAGAAGMVKAILALHHKVLPPTINVVKPNSKFDIENSAIYINTETRPWLTEGQPRRAGVSAFGFGGINVHITMEEYTAEHQKPYRIHQPYKTVFLAANSPQALQILCQNTLAQLQSEGATTAFLNLIASSKNKIVASSDARIGFVVDSLETAKSFLQIASQNLTTKTEAWDHPKGIYYRPNGIAADTKVVALFAGQGSQYVGMGSTFINAFPTARQTFVKADQLFQQNKQTNLSKTIFPIPVFSDEERKVQQQKLTQTENAQPAIGTLSMAQYKVLQAAGFKADFTAGHSFGELTALWAAGVYDDEVYLALAQQRGAAMASPSSGDTGTMLAVKAPYEQVKEEIAQMEGVTIANVNSTKQVVLGGSNERIKYVADILSSKGYSVIPLPVSAAFHTSFVKHAQQPFASFVHKQKFNKPSIPVYANTTAQPYPDQLMQIKSILKDQILNPVLFKDQIENIYAAGGRVFVEFGPKGVLTNLVKDILRDKNCIAISLNPNAKKDSDLQFRQAHIQLSVIGLALSEADCYSLPLNFPPEKTKLNIRLSGNNYMSTPTQKAYYDVMNDGFQIAGGQTKVVEKIVEIPVVKEVEKIIEVPIQSYNHHQNLEEEIMNKELIEVLKTTMEHFKNQQSKSLEVFEKYFTEQNQQANQLLQILSQAINTNNVSQPITVAKAQPVAAVTNVVAEIPAVSKIATNGNGNRNVTISTGSNGNGQTTTSVAPNPVSTSTSSSTGLNRAQLEKILLDVISEKTGYPQEMLELNMDMEADLGIDSIKRVEIFGAMTEQYPQISGIDPKELTELRTLAQIVDYIEAKGGNGSVSSTVKAMPSVAPIPTPVSTPSVPSTGTGLNRAQLEKILLDVISEKTGYPQEMLELNMDMEADLGIDSIKRVEIFGAMTEQYPQISGIDPKELTELRTLAQIVDYIETKGGGSTPTNLSSSNGDVEILNSSVAPSPVSTTTTTSTGLNRAQLEKILLDVISEKTGYPQEMLELNMDMEADLGIDSIKRVEIFGAMTEQYPQISGIDPKELTELRTLKQIVDYIESKGSKK